MGQLHHGKVREEGEKRGDSVGMGLWYSREVGYSWRHLFGFRNWSICVYGSGRNKKEKSNRRRVGTRAKVEEYDDNDEEGSEMPPRR
ncbi:uncharacterized protein LAJ45_07614 [Morchella importuna]|uniref:uncharacterized protein n=1 Tax=Morchella importuna TaxID=1174673 RepID=UPI001E8DD0DB|nr:uncharacterized protein LAJ45_07614 [Morchella importuna]KAH8148511.1 hypothetical protein LAJ45_07614 [Morchella importuna]